MASIRCAPPPPPLPCIKGPILSSPVDERLRRLLLKEAYAQGRSAVFISAIALFGLVGIHWHESGTLLAPGWLAIAATLILLRAGIISTLPYRFERKSTAMLERCFVIPLLAASLAWAALPLLTFATASEVERFGMVCIYSGLAAGAVVALSPWQWAARFFIACLLLPVYTQFLLLPGREVLGVLGYLFFAVICMSHGRSRRSLIEVTTARFAHSELQARLETERDRVQSLNADLRAAEASLRRRNQSLEEEVAERTECNRLAHTVIQNVAEGILVTDTDFIIVHVNPAASQITGLAAEALLGNPITSLGAIAGDPDHDDAMLVALRSTGAWTGELWRHRPDGARFLERRSVSPVRDPSGATSHYIFVIRDITEAHVKDEQLRHLANHDQLTGLANRGQLSTRLARQLEAVERLAVLFLDLDGFKAINDNLGHDAGDALLQILASRLRACLDEGATIARFGGDEFVVVLAEPSQVRDCGAVAARILGALQTPVVVSGTQVQVGTCIGIATYPQDGTSAQALLKHADLALYAAKAAGRNQFRLFNPSLADRAATRASLESALKLALQQRELRLHYQAKVHAHDGGLVGFEALVRWERPGVGLVDPETFIPWAEASGIIEQLGAWVIDEACQQLADWYQGGFGWQRVAINLSPMQLLRGDIAHHIAVSMARYGLPRGLLEVEVTESVFQSELERSLPVLQEIRKLGVPIAIDDFGTGHSSLARLRHLPVDIIKIDRAFVQDASHCPTSQAIIRAIVGLCRAMELKVIAEGVESQAQRDVLAEFGCDHLQGFYFSRPMSVEELTPLWLMRQPEATVLRGSASGLA